ncbi:MAG TPA: YncE family protein [Chloroflexota bacterium]|jgi:DNA-binding beta-propeller fold protein YncE
MQVRILLTGVAACAILGMAACSGGAPQDTEGQLTAAQAEIAQLRTQLQQARASAATQGGPAATENVVYGFGPGRIAIIEPQSARVVKEITSGLERTDFADPIVTPDNRWLLVNDQANAQVVVIDTAKQEIAKRIDVGPRPVHIFNPLKSNEIWTHSDEEGAFYVIDTNTMEVTARVVAARDNTGHGKLIDHPTLGSKAYATNVTSPDVWIVDLQGKQVTGSIPVCDGQGGTHAKAYSSVSRHAYFECTATGKTMVIDTGTDTVLKQLDGSGYLQTSPDEKYVVVLDKRNSRIQLIDASKGSEIAASIPVEGGADSLGFFEDGGRLYAFTANTLAPDAALVDFQDMKVVKRVAAGDIVRPEGASTLHRHGETDGNYFLTSASADGVITIIDTGKRTLHAAVPLPSANEVAYVGTRR